MNARRRNTKTSRIGDDLEITKVTPREQVGGTWVCGTIAGHRFQALVFPQHAEQPEYELGESRISKLWVQRIADKTTVVNFDRGWDHLPANPTVGKIVDFLAEGLAALIDHP